MHIQLPYGKTKLSLDLPDSAQIIAPKDVPPAPNPIELAQHALAKPQGGKTLADFGHFKTVAIAINDKTRPVPHAELLPPLLEALHDLGAEKIVFVIANGTHPPMPPDEFPMILPPEIIAKYEIVSHDAYNPAEMVDLGKTPHGTPVLVNRQYVAADLRIVVGNIEPHQFMGFSGGVKSVAVGIASLATINHNHALMTHPESRLGQYDHNPARQDVEAIGQLIRVDFALNALLNGGKKIVNVLAGDPRAVMQAAIPQVREIFQVPVPHEFDFIISSTGGHPKDINLYQAQKALAHAALITKTGGTVLVLAACPEGTGSAKYEKWMDGMSSYEAVFERFAREGYQVGPHKAYQLARDAARVKTYLYSEMSADFVEKLLLHPVIDLDKTLGDILGSLPDTAQIGIMPAANATIPILIDRG